jgi:hypothetical protein
MKWFLAYVVMIALIAGILFVGMLSDQGKLFGFDGWVFEPGCDLGNPNCEAEDYRESCRYPSPEEKILWRVHCQGRYP